MIDTRLTYMRKVSEFLRNIEADGLPIIYAQNTQYFIIIH